jgi:hypothetical protein
MDHATVSMEPQMVWPCLLPMIRTPHRLHTSCAPHLLHTVDSTRRPARAPRLRRRRSQSDCSFRRHRRVPPSSHLCRAPPSSHRRLHWPLASCACAAPLARPTVFTPSIPLAVGVLRVRRACEGGEPNQTARSVAAGAPHRLHTSCAPHHLHTVDSTGRRRPARAPGRARPTVFTPSTPPAVGVLRVRRACSLMQVS